MTKQQIDELAGAPCQTYAESPGRKITRGSGFSAQSYQNTDFLGLMDPLIMVDHFRMSEPTFGTHPHAGLSAVTVVLEDSEGAFRNQDSLGNDIDLEPGDLYWFKAARGAVHNEQPRPGAKTHALQVFVSLSAENRHDAPEAFHIPTADIPTLFGDQSKARLVLGDSNGVTAAQAPDAPLTLLDITVQPGGRFLHQGAQGHHAWILAIEGAPTIGWNNFSTKLQPGTAIALADAKDITISADNGAHAVLFRGPPLRQALIQRGPFAMGSTAELDAVEADYLAGRLGSID